SSDATRSKNFGKMAVSSNLGFILGPALAGILGGTIYGTVLPVLAALILSLVTIIVIVFLLRESKLSSSSEEMLVPEQGTIRKTFSQECRECYLNTSTKKPRMQNIFKLKHISFLLVLYFLIFLGFNIYYATFPTHAAKDLKWSVTQLGIFYAILSGIMVLIQGPVLRKALKRFSEEKLVKIGSVILATNFILFVSNNIVSVGGAIILFAVGNGLMWPSFMSILSRYAGSKLQGSVQGIAGSFGGLASILGLVLGGFLYNSIGAVTFLSSAGVIFSIFLMSFQLLKWK
ncbi:MAG: MFS transporter, partial [Nitrososphaeraceae archaeon]|nr:MFS transporter [Nitrososphaeraceae archaeon]